MRTAVVCCSGVGQTKWLSDGIGDLAEKLQPLPNVTVFLRRRFHSEHDMAITLTHEQDFDRILMAAHSEGARWCRDVAGYCLDAGRDVEGMFLSDGWIKGGDLLIPRNVRRVEAWIQSTKRPAWKRIPHGSEIRTESPDTFLVVTEAPLDVGHVKMSSLPDFHVAVFNRAKG
jgi:hypothetical protein